jgi:3-phenylpropionate/cinnamic acid dioxygenase small subunit
MTIEETLKTLHDRALISDVLYAFAEYLDTKRWHDWIDLFADDGVLVIPTGEKSKATLQADGGPKGLMKLHATHHLSSNHRLEIEGDLARARSYVQATHVVAPDDRSTQWVVGGWYDTQLRRTAGGWKIVRNELTAVWK